MKTNYKKVLCVAVLLGSAVTISAQEKKEQQDLDREMTLEREYDPTVQDANKVNTLPEIKEPEVIKHSIDYSDFTLATDPEKQISVLPSGDFMTQMDYNKRRGYLNVGAGMHLNVDGDFGYHILSTGKDKLNLFFSHRSTNGKANYGTVDYWDFDEDTKAKLNDNLGGINYAHVFDKAILNLGAQYRYTGFNYWGIPPRDTSLGPNYYLNHSDRETNQVNQMIQAKVGVEAHEDADLFYLVDLDYINFSHKYGASAQLDGPTEHTIDVKFDLNARFNGEQRIGIGGQVEYFNYNLPIYPDGTQSACVFQNHAEIILTPYYRVAGDNWKVQLGANVMLVTGEEKSFTASPNIMADVEVADRTVLYLTAKGRLYSNSAYETSLVNRYVNPTEEIAPTREWLNGQIGLKSGVAKSFWFDVFAGYRIASSDCLFLPARSFYYDQGFAGFLDAVSLVNTKRFFAGANLKYSYQDFLDISLKGVYNHWTAEYDDEANWVPFTPDIEHVWGKPKVELDADVTVKPIDKLAISLNYHLAIDRYTELSGYKVVKLDNVNELNLTGSYTFNDTFGIYVKATNLLNQDYDLYYGYPNQGITLMGGVNINF